MRFLKQKCGKYIKQVCFKMVTAFKVYMRFAIRLVRGRYRKKGDMRYPTTIQLPITYKCNFDCVMCGMQSMVSRPGFTPEELKHILSDHLFYQVSSVGVNGGEPFLLKNIEEYIRVLFDCLPKLKNVYIISNGYCTDAILAKSKEIASICRAHRATFHLSISVDGYGEMQDIMRGRSGAFEHAVNTCRKIMQNQVVYCDSFGAICTITKINVYNLAEIDIWAKQQHLPMSYNIATIHKRIANDAKYLEFSVFTDEHARLMAAEFFYSKYIETKEEKYFGLYYMIYAGERIASCTHQTDVVTLTPDGGISYCATHSDEIGNAHTEKAEKLFFSSKNINYRKQMRNEYCNNCSHYSGPMTGRNYFFKYAKERMRETKNYR